jgi:ribosomal protein S18 acetylase RimI-like enzyme
MAAYPLSASVKQRWFDLDTNILHICRYEASDHPDVLWLHEATLRDAGAYVEDDEWDEDLQNIEANYLVDGDFLVGIYRGRLVAMGAIRRTGPDRAEIKRMRVETGFQGRGFGQSMLSALEGCAAEEGYKTLHLDTSVGQEAARRLYINNGYREVGRGKVWLFDCVFYEKTVPD